jgi:hypothetical protein
MIEIDIEIDLILEIEEQIIDRILRIEIDIPTKEIEIKDLIRIPGEIILRVEIIVDMIPKEEIRIEEESVPNFPPKESELNSIFL